MLLPFPLVHVPGAGPHTVHQLGGNKDTLYAPCLTVR